MKEYSAFENRETDWLFTQKRSEKKSLDLNEAKDIKKDHEIAHQKASTTGLMVVAPKPAKKKHIMTLIEVLGVIMFLFAFMVPLLISLITLAPIMPLFK